MICTHVVDSDALVCVLLYAHIMLSIGWTKKHAEHGAWGELGVRRQQALNENNQFLTMEASRVDTRT